MRVQRNRALRRRLAQKGARAVTRGQFKPLQSVFACTVAHESRSDCCQFCSRSRKAIPVMVVNVASLYDLLGSTGLVVTPEWEHSTCTRQAEQRRGRFMCNKFAVSFAGALRGVFLQRQVQRVWNALAQRPAT